MVFRFHALCTPPLKRTSRSGGKGKQKGGKGNANLIYLDGGTGVHIRNADVCDV